jgi:glycosyltransferase involved in cell wall biosynthesis
LTHAGTKGIDGFMTNCIQAAQPQISIVMPSYQQAAYLEEAVRSVLDQREVDVELLVMDPGSTDGSRELLLALKAEYGDKLLLHFSPDTGQSDAVNRGMAMAKGDVMGWLNSDDRLRPGALQRVVLRLSGTTPAWLYGRAGIIDAAGRPVMNFIVHYKNWRGRRFSLAKLITEDFIPQMSAFWNRSMWQAEGNLNLEKHLDMDYDLFLRFATVADPFVLTDELADFRVHGSAKSSRQYEVHLDAAYATAREYAARLGLKGRIALFVHWVFSQRTRMIYRWIKPA